MEDGPSDTNNNRWSQGKRLDCYPEHSEFDPRPHLCLDFLLTDLNHNLFKDKSFGRTPTCGLVDPR
jgi:hypothetical protein